MIDRNEIELRIAAHHDTTATINATAWQQGTRPVTPRRARLAAALVALAARLDPALRAPAQAQGAAGTA